MTIPTDRQRARLRFDLAVDADALSDAAIDECFARALERYPDSPTAIDPAARLIALDALIAAAAKRSDYTSGAVGDRLSQVFDHLLHLRAIYDAELRAATVAAGWAALHTPRRPPRYPHRD